MVNTAGRKNLPSTLQQAGVEDRRFRSDTLSLEELCGTSYVRVHSLKDSPLSATSAFKLPQEVGECGGDNPGILCLRPREWLFTSETRSAEETFQQLAAVTDPGETAVLIASDSFTTFRLAGSAAPWLLSKLSGLDFLAGNNGAPHCAQTKMGHVAVIVHCHQPDGSALVFDLILDRSIVKYLWSLLIESAEHARELANNDGD